MPNAPNETKAMDCLVVGGIADGVLLRKVRVDAGVIELGRPTHLKPLERADQDQPEAERETEIYQVYVQQVPDQNNRLINIGIAVPIETSLFEGFAQLVVRYVQQTTREQMDRENLLIHH